MLLLFMSTEFSKLNLMLKESKELLTINLINLLFLKTKNLEAKKLEKESSKDVLKKLMMVCMLTWESESPHYYLLIWKKEFPSLFRVKMELWELETTLKSDKKMLTSLMLEKKLFLYKTELLYSLLLNLSLWSEEDILIWLFWELCRFLLLEILPTGLFPVKWLKEWEELWI